MRMKYNPKKSMNMIILRVYKMIHPISICIKPEWSGCKSWISIEISEKETGVLRSPSACLGRSIVSIRQVPNIGDSELTI